MFKWISHTDSIGDAESIRSLPKKMRIPLVDSTMGWIMVQFVTKILPKCHQAAVDDVELEGFLA